MVSFHRDGSWGLTHLLWGAWNDRDLCNNHLYWHWMTMYPILPEWSRRRSPTHWLGRLNAPRMGAVRKGFDKIRVYVSPRPYSEGNWCLPARQFECILSWSSRKLAWASGILYRTYKGYLFLGECSKNLVSHTALLNMDCTPQWKLVYLKNATTKIQSIKRIEKTQMALLVQLLMWLAFHEVKELMA